MYSRKVLCALQKNEENRVVSFGGFRLVVLRLLVTANAAQENRTSFVCTSQLHCREVHLFPSTLGAGMLRQRLGLLVLGRQRLDRRSFRAEGGRECARFGLGNDGFGEDIFIAGSADAADHDLGGIARRLVEQVSAVVAED